MMKRKKLLFAVAMLTGLQSATAFAQESYIPMVKEGRVWKYAGSHYVGNEDVNKRGSGVVYHSMKFDGTTTINGVEYANFVLFQSDFYWQYHYDDSVYSRTDIRTGPRYYVREEQDKVYVLTEGNLIYHTSDQVTSEWFSDTYDASHFGEFAIYDFSLPEGAFGPLIGYGMIYEGSVVHWLDPIVCGGVSRRAMQLMDYLNPEVPYLPNDYIIEGIGITGNGHLACYESEYATSIFNDNSYMPQQHSRLVSVCEPDGTYIYGSDVEVKLNALPDNSHVDSSLYDLMGRPVANPQPGSIYIRNGKKVVMR